MGVNSVVGSGLRGDDDLLDDIDVGVYVSGVQALLEESFKSHNLFGVPDSVGAHLLVVESLDSVHEVLSSVFDERVFLEVVPVVLRSRSVINHVDSPDPNLVKVDFDLWVDFFEGRKSGEVNVSNKAVDFDQCSIK